ncbi:MAG TPA: PASTA domain-containing protein [Nitriliruptorales bacterium]|nr:PASTA domain-containing protein [Nitriliruptorales bacterium]
MTDRSTPTAALLGGRYRILGEIARGGMATVYHGVDEVLERDVAIKVLHRHLSTDPTFLDRFLREARAAAALSHPNVVAVHDWGEGDDGPDGDAYLVMEHVDGPSLRDILRARGRLSPTETAAVLAPAAAGLAAAHRRGLVHRDVKPENILVSAEGVVKVTDFGLARAAAATTQTFAPGSIVGSPRYLAPESVREEAVDARADVYALGVVLFECLTGRPPFEGDTALATAMRHTRETVPPPSREVEVPGALDRLVARATAPDVADRPDDAGEFETALRAAVPTGRLPTVGGDRAGQTVVIPSEATDTLVPGVTPPVPPQRPAEDDQSGARAPRRWLWRPRRPRSGRARRRPRLPAWLGWRRALLPLLLLGLVAGGGYLAWDQLLAPLTDVPDVIGLPQDEAAAALEQDGFVPVMDAETVFTRDVAEGSVADQEPRGTARLGAAVTLTMSAGPPEVASGVPAVVGQPKDQAVGALARAHLQPEVVEQHSEEVAEGVVIATDPPPGTPIRELATVTVTVSLGRQPLEVPEVTGRSRDAAEQELAGIGLAPVVAAEEFSDEAPAGAVVAQDPPAGARLFRGDEVRLTVSKGPQPFPMPDVEGRPRDDAVRQLEGLGLRVAVREQDGGVFKVPKGQVALQEPKAGTTVHRGDTVTIRVWK